MFGSGKKYRSIDERGRGGKGGMRDRKRTGGEDEKWKNDKSQKGREAKNGKGTIKTENLNIL